MIRRNSRSCAPAVAIAASLVLATAAVAHDSRDGARGDQAAHVAAVAGHKTKTDSDARVTVHDSMLVDQTGKRLRLRRDVIGDNIVVLDFIYTSCTTICPVSTSLMGVVHNHLKKMGASGVRMVSISIDPVTDTPRRLRNYVKKHGIPGDWTFLTGDKNTVDKVLTGLGAYSANFEDHPGMVMIGDGRTGKWTRYFGLPDPKAIAARVSALRNDADRHGALRGNGTEPSQGHMNHQSGR